MQAKAVKSDKEFPPREKESSPYHSVCSVHFLPPPLPHPFITKYDSFISHLHRVIFQYQSGSTTNPTSSSPKSAKQHPVWRQKHLTMSTEPKSLEMFKKVQ